MFGTDRDHSSVNDPDIASKSWTFYSFRPRYQQRDVHTAAEWMMDYAKRYSHGEVIILTDFDEHYDLFPSVEFRISRIITGEVDINRLQLYRDRLGLPSGSVFNTYIDTYIETQTVREIIMGDKFDINGNNNTVVNRSTVQNAFNKVKAEHDEATAQALKTVEERINASGNADAGDNFNGFTEELQKPEPKKPLLKTLWGGTVAALPTLLSLPGVAENIKKLFTP